MQTKIETKIETKLQGQMQEMQTQMEGHLQEMQGHIHQIQNQIRQMERSITIEAQRSRNYGIRSTRSAITVLMRALDGKTPQDENLWFPVNRYELFDVTLAQIDRLLEFYGLPPNGSLVEKQNRLSHYLGVTI